MKLFINSSDEGERHIRDNCLQQLSPTWMRPTLGNNFHIDFCGLGAQMIVAVTALKRSQSELVAMTFLYYSLSLE